MIKIAKACICHCYFSLAIVLVFKSLVLSKPSKKSVIESMMETLEGYVLHLEDKVQERTVELATANEQLQRLLHQIIPPSVAGRLVGLFVSKMLMWNYTQIIRL